MTAALGSGWARLDWRGEITGREAGVREEEEREARIRLAQLRSSAASAPRAKLPYAVGVAGPRWNLSNSVEKYYLTLFIYALDPSN